MEKIIDLNKTIFEIYSKYPEIVDIMKELGFDQIAVSGMINTVGRFMTIPKGAKMKNIELAAIIRILEEKGFCVIG